MIDLSISELGADTFVNEKIEKRSPPLDGSGGRPYSTAWKTRRGPLELSMRTDGPLFDSSRSKPDDGSLGDKKGTTSKGEMIGRRAPA